MTRSLLPFRPLHHPSQHKLRSPTTCFPRRRRPRNHGATAGAVSPAAIAARAGALGASGAEARRRVRNGHPKLCIRREAGRRTNPRLLSGSIRIKFGRTASKAVVKRTKGSKLDSRVLAPPGLPPFEESAWQFKGWVNVNAAEGGCFADWSAVVGDAKSADNSIELQIIPQC